MSCAARSSGSASRVANRVCRSDLIAARDERGSIRDDSPIVVTFEEPRGPSMNQEQVTQARPPAQPTTAEETPAQKLEALGVRGILRQLARDGQIIDVRC